MPSQMVDSGAVMCYDKDARNERGFWKGLRKCHRSPAFGGGFWFMLYLFCGQIVALPRPKPSPKSGRLFSRRIYEVRMGDLLDHSVGDDPVRSTRGAVVSLIEKIVGVVLCSVVAFVVLATLWAGAAALLR